jgi:hypothetical protein
MWYRRYWRQAGVIKQLSTNVGRFGRTHSLMFFVDVWCAKNQKRRCILLIKGACYGAFTNDIKNISDNISYM